MRIPTILLRFTLLMAGALSALHANPAAGAAARPPVVSKPTPASDTAFPEPASRPKGALSYWSSAKTQTKGTTTTVTDVVGGNTMTLLPGMKVLPGEGIEFDGNQTGSAVFLGRQPVAPGYVVEFDVKPVDGGAEYQTFLYLYGFCELRYRVSKKQVSLVVWRRSIETGEPMAMGSGNVTLPIVPGKWNRVRVLIDANSARLFVNGTGVDTALEGTWEGLPPTSPLMLGFGGADRAFQGRIDHILLGRQP
ncbi:MAG: hypothetical protein RL376_345 [Verrucomicrobiota bacterium]|jgi:hypothetical protein